MNAHSAAVVLVVVASVLVAPRGVGAVVAVPPTPIPNYDCCTYCYCDGGSCASQPAGWTSLYAQAFVASTVPPNTPGYETVDSNVVCLCQCLVGDNLANPSNGLFWCSQNGYNPTASPTPTPTSNPTPTSGPTQPPLIGCTPNPCPSGNLCTATTTTPGYTCSACPTQGGSYLGNVGLFNVGGKLIVRWSVDTGIAGCTTYFRVQSLQLTGSPLGWEMTDISPMGLCTRNGGAKACDVTFSESGGNTVYELNTGVNVQLNAQSGGPEYKYKVDFLSFFPHPSPGQPPLSTSQWPGCCMDTKFY